MKQTCVQDWDLYNFVKLEERCIFCSSGSIVRHGKRITTIATKQRYFCKTCHKTFVIDPLPKIKGNGQIVTLALDLYFKGVSLRKISDHVNQFYGINISHETVRQWIMRFIELMNKYVTKLQPRLSNVWHADEQVIKSKGKFVWSWNLLDERTRFLIANRVTETRTISDARQIFTKAKHETGLRPEYIITDGLWSYERAIRKEFWRYPRAKHIRLASIKDKPNNNLIERYHSTFRERDKTMRGFKGNETAQALITGFGIYYNFIRKNQALDGQTPSQVAGIELNLERNRWLSLLEQSLKDKNNGHKQTEPKKVVEWLVKVYESGEEIKQPKKYGLAVNFRQYEKARRSAEFYKAIYPKLNFRIIPNHDFSDKDRPEL